MLKRKKKKGKRKSIGGKSFAKRSFAKGSYVIGLIHSGEDTQFLQKALLLHLLLLSSGNLM